MFHKGYPNQGKLEFISVTCEFRDNGKCEYLAKGQGLLTEEIKFVTWGIYSSLVKKSHKII